MTTASTAASGATERQNILLWQVLFGVGVIALWEICGRTFGSNWTSLPSLVMQRLILWGSADLFEHIAVTLTEVFVGLGIGMATGLAAGLLLGRTDLLAVVLRPIIVALYSIPLITMAPLIILWFGLEMQSKIVLVTLVVFFLTFFTTFAGVRAIDPSLIETLNLMGATTREQYQKVIAPASMAWIMSGIKISMPYALAAATTGELLAGKLGLGTLLTRAASQFDMTGLYATLVVLLAIGIVLGALVDLAERRLLRWRNATE